MLGSEQWNIILKVLSIKERIEEKKVFDEQDALKLIEDSTGSLRYLKRVIKCMHNKFGKKAFTPY